MPSCLSAQAGPAEENTPCSAVFFLGIVKQFILHNVIRYTADVKWGFATVVLLLPCWFLHECQRNWLCLRRLHSSEATICRCKGVSCGTDAAKMSRVLYTYADALCIITIRHLCAWAKCCAHAHGQNRALCVCMCRLMACVPPAKQDRSRPAGK